MHNKKRSSINIFNLKAVNGKAVLPNDDGVFMVDLNNGFRVAAGETYLFTFVGCVDGLSVCHDVCYAVIGYGR